MVGTIGTGCLMMPATVTQRLADRPAGSHFVEDLDGTGLTGEIVDPDAKAVAGFVN